MKRKPVFFFALLWAMSVFVSAAFMTHFFLTPKFRVSNPNAQGMYSWSESAKPFGHWCFECQVVCQNKDCLDRLAKAEAQ